MKQFILHPLIILTAGLLFILSCEREHSNIFDPKSSIESLDLGLHIRQSDSVVVLKWRAPSGPRYSGFNIFRKDSAEEIFDLAASVARDSLSWTDRQIQSGRTYSYYITVRGDGVQSPATPVITTTPGPDRFWILDRWNFYILHLTSDLRHTIASHFAVDRPQNMCMNTSGNTALITYTRQHYLEVFNPQNGTHLTDFYRLEKPYDCLFDAANKRFWISDSSGAVFTLDEETLTLRSVNETLQRPSQIELDAQGRLYVLNAQRKQIVRLNPDGSVADTLYGLGTGIFQFDIDFKRNLLYAVCPGDSLKYLRRYSITDSASVDLFSDPSLQLVRHSPRDASIWIALNNDHSGEIVQLSAEGLRLNVLNGLNYILDMNISSASGDIIAGTLNVNTREGLLLHLKPDGSVVGSSKQVYYPYRIYIR